MRILLICFLLCCIPLAAYSQKKAAPQKKAVPKPTPKVQKTAPNPSEFIVVTADPKADETQVMLKYVPVGSNLNQIMNVGGIYTSKTPNEVQLVFKSISRSYRYNDYRDVDILLDGRELNYFKKYLSKYIDTRTSSVDGNGNAVETLRIYLTFVELDAIASANRVDLTMFTDRFVMPSSTLQVLKEYVGKIRPLRLEALAKNQEKKTGPIASCLLTLKQSPEIKGIRLGMPSRDALSGFNTGFGSSTGNKVNMDGVDVVVYAYYDFGGGGTLARTKDWENVEYVRFRFLDDKLLVFEIYYNNKELKLWTDTKSFVKVLSERMTLPSELVDHESSSGFGLEDSKWAFCQGWTMEMNGSEEQGKIMLTDTAAKTAYLEAIEAKKRQEGERKQKDFKPF